MTNRRNNFIEQAKQLLEIAQEFESEQLWRKNEIGDIITILSACAIEKHTNELLSQHVLVVDSIDSHRSLIPTLERSLRAPIPRKLDDIFKVVEKDKQYKGGLKEVFTVRNRIVHAKPTYYWGRNGVPVDSDDESIPWEARFAPKSSEFDSFERSKQHLEVAIRYIEDIGLNDYKNLIKTEPK